MRIAAPTVFANAHEHVGVLFLGAYGAISDNNLMARVTPAYARGEISIGVNPVSGSMQGKSKNFSHSIHAVSLGAAQFNAVMHVQPPTEFARNMINSIIPKRGESPPFSPDVCELFPWAIV